MTYLLCTVSDNHNINFKDWRGMQQATSPIRRRDPVREEEEEKEEDG